LNNFPKINQMMRVKQLYPKSDLTIGNGQLLAASSGKSECFAMSGYK